MTLCARHDRAQHLRRKIVYDVVRAELELVKIGPVCDVEMDERHTFVDLVSAFRDVGDENVLAELAQVGSEVMTDKSVSAYDNMLHLSFLDGLSWNA